MNKTIVFLIVCTFLLTVCESKLLNSKSVPKIQVADNVITQRTVDERAATCPNNCSGNGVCNAANFTCVCNTNYTGSDCSIMIAVLTNGQSVSNTVKTFVWQYYRVNTAYRGNTLSFVLNQTGDSGDCDLYGKFNALPTRSNYDLRDISTSTSMQITFNGTQVGSYYLGVYGFSTCSYTVKAIVTGSCPSDCSGHGSCFNGVCVCSGGWAGSDCSVPVTDLVSGIPVLGYVKDFQMTSYRVQVTDSNFLYVKLQQTSPGDCDLYLRKDNEPTIWLWDYANVTLNNVSSISVTDATAGYYYAGVYGFHACNYTIMAQTSMNCPNQCSKHGSCNTNDTCQCDSGFSGDYCQTMTDALSPSEIVNGYVELNSWNYFSYASSSDDNMIVSITSSNGGDCDLYVRANSLPTRFKYDYQEISTQKNFSLSIEDPGTTTWYIGVYGWSLCSFTISITESAQCPDSCTLHGSCQANGACICNSGWAGIDCSQVLNPLSVTGTAVTNSLVKVNAWVYYNVTVTSATTVLVLVKETSTSGFLQVYVAKTTPTLTSFMYNDVSSSSVHRIAMDTPQGGPATWIVGVYGDAEQVNPNGTNFGIVAWSPVFV